MIDRRTAALSATLAALNAAVCWPLFGTEYLNQFPSIEVTFIAIAKFMLEHAQHTACFPWINAGLPFENTYLPLVAWLTAAGAFLTRTSPAHAFHFFAALAYTRPLPRFFFFWPATEIYPAGSPPAFLPPCSGRCFLRPRFFPPPQPIWTRRGECAA